MYADHPLFDDWAHVFFDKSTLAKVNTAYWIGSRASWSRENRRSFFVSSGASSRQPKQGCNHSRKMNVIERVHQNQNHQKTKEVFPCSATRPSSAKIADKASPSPPASRNSTRKRVSPMSPSAARIAVPPASRALPVAAATVRCMTQPAQAAANPARFPSSPVPTVLFTAATASASNWSEAQSAPARERFFVPLFW